MSEEDAPDSDGEGRGWRHEHKKKIVQKSSLADAFKSIMSRNVGGQVALGPAATVAPREVSDKPATAEQGLILAKYKKRERDLEEAKAKEDEAAKKRVIKE